MAEPRILDFEGVPHDADTGARITADNEPSGHWVDALPPTPLDGLTLTTSPSDMVRAANGEWMRRDECEARFGVSDFLRDVRKAAKAKEHTPDEIELRKAG